MILGKKKISEGENLYLLDTERLEAIWCELVSDWTCADILTSPYYFSVVFIIASNVSSKSRYQSSLVLKIGREGKLAGFHPIFLSRNSGLKNEELKVIPSVMK